MQSLKTGYEYDHSGDDIDDAHCYGIRAPGICKFFCIFSIENIHADCTDYTLDNDGADIFIDDDEEDREEEQFPPTAMGITFAHSMKNAFAIERSRMQIRRVTASARFLRARSSLYDIFPPNISPEKTKNYISYYISFHRRCNAFLFSVSVF